MALSTMVDAMQLMDKILPVAEAETRTSGE